MSDDHATLDARSLAFHRVVADRLDDAGLARARAKVSGWLADDTAPVPSAVAERWQRIVGEPLDRVRAAIVADDEEMRGLRQSSPFAGALTRAERDRIDAMFR